MQTNYLRNLTMSVNFYNYTTTSSVSSTSTTNQSPQTHTEGLKHYHKMTVPREVEEEKNLKLIEKEKATSATFANQLSFVTDPEIRQLMETLDTLDFKHAPKDSVLLNPKLPYITLEALRIGLLDRNDGQKQAATILNFWAALQCHQNPNDLQTFSVVHPEAKKMITATLKHSSENRADPFLMGAKFDVFMEKLHALPLSEQRFLIVPDIQGDDPIIKIAEQNGGNLFKATISQSIKATGINVFNRLIYAGKPMRMIPSTGMMQAFLEAQYGDDAVEIKPRTYLSTLQHIYDTRLTDTSDMMMPTPDAEGKSRCPTTADHYQAPWYDFPYHDFFHAILLSTVGQTYRNVGVTASDIIQTFAQIASPEDQKGLKQLAVSMIDMEYSQFHHFVEIPNFSKRHYFWLTINDQILLQRTKFETVEALKQIKVTPPCHVYPISEQTELEMFNALYQTFVNEQMGPAELNEESFKAAAEWYKNDIEEDLDLGEISEEEFLSLLDHPILQLGKILKLI